MDNIFEFTKHNILWLHMAEDYTIEKLAYCMNRMTFMNEKEQYVTSMFGDNFLDDFSWCYACLACSYKCTDCPIDIGICGERNNLYEKYMRAVVTYAITNDKSAKEEAQKIALEIANAPKNKNTDIEYIWR